MVNPVHSKVEGLQVGSFQVRQEVEEAGPLQRWDEAEMEVDKVKLAIQGLSEVVVEELVELVEMLILVEEEAVDQKY